MKEETNARVGIMKSAAICASALWFGFCVLKSELLYASFNTVK